MQGFQLPKLVPNIPDNISIPRMTIPAINVPLPDITSLSFSMSAWTPGSPTSPTRAGSAWELHFSPDIPDLPSFNLPVPASASSALLGAAFSPIADIFDLFRPFFDSPSAVIDSLQAIPDTVGQIVEQGRGLLSDTRQLFVQWGQTLLSALSILGC